MNRSWIVMVMAWGVAENAFAQDAMVPPPSASKPEAATASGSDTGAGEGSAAGTTDGSRKLELTLEACVRAVLERNLALKIAELGNLATVTGIEQALGSFDPELYANVSGGDREQPTASKFQAPRNQNLSGSSGLRGLYRSGLAYDLAYRLNYNRQSPSNTFTTLNPTISSDLSASLTQPLLRGFGPTVNEAPVEQARLLVARGDLDLYGQVQETAFRAVEAYWGLVRARNERDTAKEALAVAEELVGNNQKRLDAGVMTRLDVLTAKAEAARRREALIRAENGVGRTEDVVKALLSPGADPRDWNVDVTPTTAPAVREEALPTEEDALLVAFAERADLRALEVDLRAADLNLEVAANRRLPKLDVTGVFGFAGLAGNGQTGASRGNLDLWGNSLADIRDGESEQWSVGFDFSRPIGNRAAEAGERKAQLEKLRSSMMLLERRMAIVQEVRGARRDVGNAKAAYDAAHQARLLAEEQYQAERVRLDNDHSTTFQVREAQRDLFEAVDRETASITDYEVLVASLDRASGQLAQKHGVSFETVGRLEGELRE